ncbi:MAG: choice-of-anchor O protein [Chloroflexi bacterium]|nr:choice-of-anchor O protein [Chloroflexota bacterium]
MKRRKILLLFIAITIASLIFSVAQADDGQMFRRNVAKTPELESDKAQLSMMDFYVPAQGADGIVLTEGIPYYDANDVLLDTRYYAKPLVASYIDAIEEEETRSSLLPGMSIKSPTAVYGGVTFGERDAFIAVSLDDGSTWKTTNVSRAADLSSFRLANGHDYPGDTFNMVHAVAGDKILAAWLSKYCDGGTPAYTLVDDVTGEPIYPDLFGVSGKQGSVDYTLQGYPEIGEIPYSCVWTARGTLVYNATSGIAEVIWRKAERLTSGARDANVLAVDGAKGAGFVLVWQEDPDGLRPGQGLGPGEGWSGAIVNQKTDMWYSYIGWDDFDMVQDDDGNPILLQDYLATVTVDSTLPKVGVPTTMPSRLTDNNMCKADPKYDSNGDLLNPYCYYDFANGVQYEGANPSATFCAESVSWTNPGGTTLNICKAQDGRVLTGRTGASRTRLNLKPYTKPDGTKSAWVVMAYEETKALGYTEDEELGIDPIDIGKNVWYHSFDMFTPDIVAQGGMLNQPEIDRATGTFYPMETDTFGNLYYRTEIARRFALMTESPTAAANSASHTSGILIYKQGIINQGGPADIFLRRLVVPDGFDPTVDNPYAFANMDCGEWTLTDGSNPNYLQGVCLSPAINASGTTIVSCDNGTSGTACADTFPWEGGTNDFPKVYEWVQTVDNLDDQSWDNPFDVSKGHRGILDGDFVMLMYAWAPNWKANTVGNDHYNLYVRRSFDGGVTWTTTPASLGGDGTTTCEWYGLGGDAVETCTDYGPGEFEQARNVSQLVGNKITVLDPRYTPSGSVKLTPTILTDWLTANGLPTTGLPYTDDLARDRSRFFIVYETGDNTTVAEGEAVPLDLYYSRAYDYGDDYDYVEYYKDKDGDGSAELYQEWDWLENKQEDLSGEASVTANPGATFFYAIWNQWNELEEDVITNSDPIFRRVLYVDDADSLPTVTILYKSHNKGVDYTSERVQFVGTASDRDHLGGGIVGYEWTSNLDGTLGTTQILDVPVTSLSIGTHTITLSVVDDEGNEVSTSFSLMVYAKIYTIQLPVLR